MSDLKSNNKTQQQANHDFVLKTPLLQPPKQAPVSVSHKKTNSFSCSWLTLLGFAFLTFNSGMAINRSRGDPWSVAFIVSSFLDLLLLFFCLHEFEKTPRNSSKRTHLKIAVWVLSTFLTVMFSYRVAALMPLAVAIVLWAMSLSTIAGGFYLFFIFREEVEKIDLSADLKPAKIAEGP